MDLGVEESDCVVAEFSINDEVTSEGAGGNGEVVIAIAAVDLCGGESDISADGEAVVAVAKLDAEISGECGGGGEGEFGSAAVDGCAFEATDTDAVESAGDFELVCGIVAGDECIAILKLNEDITGEQCAGFETFGSRVAGVNSAAGA